MAFLSMAVLVWALTVWFKRPLALAMLKKQRYFHETLTALILNVIPKTRRFN
jgi:hypothetical protein